MGGVGRGRGVYSTFMHGRSRMTITIRPSHPYNAGTEHVGFSPTCRALLAPSTVRCSASRMKGELHPTKNRV